MSRHFGETLRKSPAEADTPGHGLLLRAGYIRGVAPGLFSYLPLGVRALRKVEAAIRQELDAIGGLEVAMPLIQPAKLWRRARRLHGDELVRFRDRVGRELVIGTSHEEVAAELARSDITSYRQLPALLYQIRPTFRDEARTHAGLIRAREFDLLDCYSFDRDREGLEEQYAKLSAVFERIFERIGLTNLVVASREHGEERTDEFLFLSEVGDEGAVICDACGHAANLRTARFKKPQPVSEPARPLEKVATPGTDTIQSLAEYLGITAERTAKVVFFSAGVPTTPQQAEEEREVVVMALVRGDMEVSEGKLAEAITARWIRPAEAGAIRAAGAEPGYASPIGLDHDDLIVVADDLVARSANLVSGANEHGYHFRNVNIDRDYSAGMVTDIAAAYAGAPCPACGAPLRLAGCVELGSLHRFGSGYSEALGVTFQDRDGSKRPPAMGSYGIGIGRALACIAEANNDERGLRLPASVAPCQVHLVALPGGDESIVREADALYSSLRESGIDVLYDDRDASGGVKFNDADLIGIPLRLTLGRRSLREGGVEFKRRDGDERRTVRLSETVEAVLQTTSDRQRS
ncbi:MAG: proline--tRNA ligase [Gemmatimonadota bacterium]|nr:MAG: proline--tRNA ligase [Gemmatimonadota bacterium]